MKKLFTILAIIAAFFTLLLAVLPLSNLAVFPAFLAFILGLIAYYLSKQTGEVKKIIPFTFLLTTMALFITGYKAYFVTTEVAEVEVIVEKENEFKEDALEELETLDELENIDTLEIDAIDIDSSDINTSELEALEIQ